MRLICLLIVGLIGLQAVKAQSARLNHIALHVVDLSKSTRFYQKLVGLDTIPEPFHDGKHTWFRIGGSAQLHLIQGAQGPIQPDKNTHLCFSVGSLSDFISRLNKEKIDYENWVGEKYQVTQRVDGVKQIYFQDPDLHWIEVNDAVN
ncbi:MAG: VOC family protein [Bacteroidota bacterium]